MSGVLEGREAWLFASHIFSCSSLNLCVTVTRSAFTDLLYQVRLARIQEDSSLLVLCFAPALPWPSSISSLF